MDLLKLHPGDRFSLRNRLPEGGRVGTDQISRQPSKVRGGSCLRMRSAKNCACSPTHGNGSTPSPPGLFSSESVPSATQDQHLCYINNHSLCNIFHLLLNKSTCKNLKKKKKSMLYKIIMCPMSAWAPYSTENRPLS